MRKKDLNRENVNTPAIKTELEDFFSKLEHNEHMRQVKESNNLSLLSKINKQRIASPKKRALISGNNNKLKLESQNSYFAMSNNAAKNKDESFNSHKPNKPSFNNFKEKFNGFKEFK